jgi:hypothetical protein
MTDKALELPIQDCDIKVTVGRDGVWLHLGPYAMFHVANTLGQDGHIIGGNVRKWVLAREEQANG